MAPMEYLGAWGTLIHEKNLKSKISCQAPFKSREMTGRSQTLRDGWGRRSKDDRKQNTLLPLLLNVKNEVTILYIIGSETGCMLFRGFRFQKDKKNLKHVGVVAVVNYYVI
jgi:hypothetical protein